MNISSYISQDVLLFIQSNSITFVRNYPSIFIFLSKSFRFIQNSFLFCINIISVSVPLNLRRKGLFKSLCSFILYNSNAILFVPNVINPFLISYFKNNSDWILFIQPKSFYLSFYSYNKNEL